MNETLPNQPVENNSQNSFWRKHKAIYFILAIIFLVAIGAGILIFINNYNTEEDIQSTEISNPCNLHGSNTTCSKTREAAWKTYKNEQYEFELQYPSDFYLKNQSDIKFTLFTFPAVILENTKQEFFADVKNLPKDAKVGGNVETIGTRIRINYGGYKLNGKTLEEWFRENTLPRLISSFEKKEIGSLDAYEYKSTDGHTSIYFTKGDDIYNAWAEVGCNGGCPDYRESEANELLYKVLATLKFKEHVFKPLVEADGTQKVFRDEKGNFEISIPNNWQAITESENDFTFGIPYQEDEKTSFWAVFYIYTEDQKDYNDMVSEWQNSDQDGYAPPRQIGSSGGLVYLIDYSQDRPSDIPSEYENFQKIIDTFKILK